MKRRFIFLFAFALMALLTPLGAKGQVALTGFSVANARALAQVDYWTYSSVQFTGYVNCIAEKSPNYYYVSLQDNFSNGAGIHISIPPSNMTGISVGDQVQVTAQNVQFTFDKGESYASDFISIEKVGRNTLYIMDATLQQLKDAHYPITPQRTIADHFQNRLVRLHNLTVVGTTISPSYSGWIVEDVNHVRDTIDYCSYLHFEEGQEIFELVALNCRSTGGMASRLLVRSIDDVNPTLSIRQVRQLAGTNTPVSFTGTVTYVYNAGTATIYLQESNSADGGIVVYYQGTTPSIGDIVTVQANRVDLGNDHISILSNDVNSITVVGHNDTPVTRNVQLQSLKNAHYPATPERIKNDSWQHTLVRLTNLTVVNHLQNSYFNGYVVEDQSGARDTISFYGIDSEPELPVGATLRSVKAVNCRQSGGYGGYMKLFVRSAEDIEYNPRTIHYARTHLDQTHVVEGVINYVGPINDYGWAYASIQDITGGLELRLEPPLPAVGDWVVMQVKPKIGSVGACLISSDWDDNVFISTLDHNLILPRARTDIATLYQQNQSNPGNGRHEGCLIWLQDAVGLGSFSVNTFRIYQNGNENQYVEVNYAALPTADREYLGSQLASGTLITNIVGAKSIPPYGEPHYIRLRSLDDIEIAEPKSITLDVYPTGLSTVTFTASLSQSGGTPITEAVPGQQVYLHLSTTTPNNTGIDYLKLSNSNYSKLMHHSMRCTSDSGLQLTRVNSTCWSFTMPDEEVDMKAIFTPSPNFEAICSDVWEAREGARQTENDPSKVAYLAGRVTRVRNGYGFFMEDIHNGNTGGDPLKSNNAIRVYLGYYDNSVSVGDLVYVQGCPTDDFGEIELEHAVIISKVGHTDLEQPYVTDLTTLYNDLFGEGQTVFNSRLQDRLVQLSNLHVDSQSGTRLYHVSQTIGNVTQEGRLWVVPDGVTLQENSFITAKVFNYTFTNDTEPFLLLRSEDDIFGFNEITFGTDRVEFDEMGGTVSVPLYIGANLVGTPVLSTYDSDLSFTATMNNDHTAINITVPSSNSTDDRLGLITVTVGDVDNTMAVFQSGCAPAEFALNPSYMVYGADDTQAHTLTVRNIKHVDMSLSNYVSVEVEEIENMGTSWITLGNWNEQTHSFTFTLSENTGTDARGVKIVVTMRGTDGTTSTQEASLWQNPPAAAMSLDPTEWTMGETPLCVPVTQTITVYYENAFDQTGFNNYHADYVWLDLSNLGSNFYSDIVVEPEVIPVDDSGFGTATFTLTYTPHTTGYHDGTLWARIGEYDFTKNGGLPGGAASPWIWASAMAIDPFGGLSKVTSTSDIESMTSTNYKLVPMDDTESGQDVQFYWFDSESAYCIQMMTDYLTWDGSSLNQEYFDPWMDYPENRFLWTISFDESGNAIIRPKYDYTDYYISWNNDDEYDMHFECVNEGGNPVQIYKENDGSLPNPVISAESEWFMDGDMLEVTLTPAEGTSMYYTTDGTEPIADASGTYQIFEPVTLTLMETTTIRAKSSTCSTPGSEISHTYYKLSNIADVRAAADDGNTYYIKGVVTYRENNRSLCFLQDETAGIQTSFATTVYAFENGCEVILRGTPVDNDGYITLNNAQYEITLSSDNVVEPVTVTYSELASGNYQARLVKVENVTVGTHGSGYYPLTQGSTTLYLRDEYAGPYPFTLSEGQVIDVTAVYAHNAEYIDFLIRDDDDDILVKENHNVNLVACTNAALNQYDSGWDSNIRFCDAEGNLLGNNNSYRTGSRVYFTFVDGFGVGCDAYGTPIIAVADASTAEVYCDTYINFNMEVNELNGIPNRIFSFEMPMADVEVKVWLQTEVRRTIEGYGNSENAKWAFIANPVAGTNAAYSVDNLFCNEHDLYRFDQTEDQEWQNYKANTFSFANGQGYLYGSQQDVTLVFKGDFCNEASKTVELDYAEGQYLAGWNLVGNPYGETVNLPDGLSYYTLNDEGSELEASTATTINATEAIFVKATAAGQSVTFTKPDRGEAGRSNATLSLNLSGASAGTIDRAIVRFDEGNTLSKFMLNPSHTKLYFQQGRNEYAVVRSGNQGEMPVSFKASRNGKYTLTVDLSEVAFDYLHLIDNITGDDVDLLANPSYSFEAKTSDYASRFRLVFNANEGGTPSGSDTFAYYNGSEWVIGNTGRATLQVVDVTGRVLTSETIDGNAEINIDQPAGIYMLRLINNDDVKVQKVVVR